MVKTLAILGYGQRGQIYADYARKHPEEFRLVAVTDNDPAKRELASRQNDCRIFADYREFLAEGIPADLVAVATQDADHAEHAVACMERGYDLLLEKPIATSLADCERIYAAAQQNARKVIVCHVLRYTPFYRAVKEQIVSGALGDIVTIHASENVGYYHQAHSFVRGPWRNSRESCPMIVAKCCHDMDILRWLIDAPCEEVSSIGSLTFFKPECAPAGSTAFCSDCKLECVYRAQKIYDEHRWMTGYFCADRTDEEIAEKLPHSQYDACVYRAGNDVVDHQVSIFRFADNRTACHTMTAFSKEIYRDIKIHGTKAELVGVMEENRLEVRPFGGETQVIDIDPSQTCGNHGGGDIGLMHGVWLDLNGRKTDGISYLDVSIESHRMAFGAEQARLTDTVVRLQ